MVYINIHNCKVDKITSVIPAPRAMNPNLLTVQLRALVTDFLGKI